MKHAASLLLLILASSANAEPLGRLIFAPEQRALFDAARSSPNGDTEATGVLRLDGRVVRSHREVSTWINGRSAARTLTGANELRVGESLDASSGERRDLVPRGAFAVHGPRR